MALSLCPTPVDAVKTKIWEQKENVDFREGVPKSVAISSQGDVILQQKLETVFEKANEVYIWCLAEDSVGNIYAGTGNSGKIYQISPYLTEIWSYLPRFRKNLIKFPQNLYKTAQNYPKI